MVYINNLPKGLTSNARLCTSDFDFDFASSPLSLNKGLSKILQYAMENTNKQWKMFINADVLKGTEEMVFSHKEDPSKIVVPTSITCH